ncbi:hypothetical protein SCG7109_AO_00110 [Chlamydiales bacterium SCGC AG-110-M15]|nr:hypothetical protein SCG7109_AO_00110 [Chlamydiales bacterium SCGC AG-110-M15]
MKKKITIKGDTVDYAIRKGLKKIGLSKDDTLIRVEQRESHGMFGGHQEAVVSIIYDQIESQEALDGKASEEFRRNFKFDFKDLGARICLPSMFFDSRYYENDEKRETFLRAFLEERGIPDPETDAIRQLSTNPQAQNTFVTVKTFTAIPLNDRGDMIHLNITADNMLCTGLIFFVTDDPDLPGPEEEEIFEVLKENKVFKGIKRKNLQEVLKLRHTGFFDLARGKPPIDDAPASMELFFQADESKAFGEMMDALKVDTRAVKDLNIADRNQLLVRLGEVVIGEDGFTIEGIILRKKEIAPTAAIKTGPNIYKSDNEKELFAKKAGHIVWDATENYIDIEPVYIVEGNVDYNEGNIVGFVGKVVVKGDVKPKFSVVAEGDIEIHGSVEDATVESTNGNVFVGGSIIHQSEGYIQAKNNVNGMIATNAKIRAKNIFIQKEVMNSDFDATNEIHVVGNPGVFVGGVARARSLIRMNIVGSESWVPTKVHVGDVSEKKKRLRSLNQQIGKQVSELKEAQQILNLLKERQETHDLTVGQEEQLNFAMDKIEKIEEDIEYDREEEQEIRKEIEAQEDAKLEIIKTLYPHVDLYIFEGYYLPPTAENRTGFKCKEGLIVRYSLV